MGVVNQFHTKVVGVTKQNDCGEYIQKLLKQIDETSYEGMPLDLEHEFENEYDENAIKVFCDGDHIGYLSRDVAASIVDAVDDVRVEAELDQITGGDGKSYGCNILVKILDTDATPASIRSREREREIQNALTSWNEKNKRERQIAVLRNRTKVYGALAAIYVVLAIAFFFLKWILLGCVAVAVAVAGGLALTAIKASTKVDELAEMQQEDGV